MCCGIILMWIVAVQPGDHATAKRAAMLKTFREEFVVVTPGRNGFPEQLELPVNLSSSTRGLKPERISGDFLVAKYEVTQQLWKAVMGNNPSRWHGPRNSVERVNYHEAIQFCQRATEFMRSLQLITPDQSIRLPTETEWEYCARAGTRTAYSFGDDANQLGQFGWYADNAAGNDPPVGAKAPNPWGLYDVHGYLWEWCTSVTDPNEPAVLRGGSWKNSAEQLTSSYRRQAAPELRDDAVGFRCLVVSNKPENRKLKTENRKLKTEN